MKDYKNLAKAIMANIGGEANVESLTHCVTRLRFKLKDTNKVNEAELKKVPGVLKTMISGGQYQVVIGQDVADVYDAILADYHVNAEGEVAADPAETEADKKTGKHDIVGIIADLVSAIFMPSQAALVIPPAYPAPSPIGSIPGYPSAIIFSSLFILTGDDVLDSIPERIVSGSSYPSIVLPKLSKLSRSASLTSTGSICEISERVYCPFI